ncbi:acyl-CoA dehydrogenase [Rhizobium alvei]|uniref:Acyl-CoA dehydrogenase n=1 Tax=Rhizobium alvei TaxID=1132659 RepID=A0ABT8YTI4_9HYPH|nr:acyl-CoA dehydrogenase [Rhizobium alvei]MDO6966830.1 acyl-CoA dehydrogenase [Rhizobium alvei]
MGQNAIDRDNLDFLVFDWLGLEALFAQPLFADHNRQSVAALLDLAEKLAADRFLPVYKLSDRVEPAFSDGEVTVLPEIAAAHIAYAEAGFIAAPFSAELDGLQVPETVQTAAMAQFMAANVAASAYGMLTTGNARLLAKYGTPLQIEHFVRPQLAGQATGTMCLSEPQAGSSLGDIRTRAVPDGSDALGARFRIIGNKMWISGGDHDITDNIVHLVLAKIPEADGTLPVGTAGISLFIVPKWLIDAEGKRGDRNDVIVAGLNHKMGYRGTSNCLLNFGEGTRFRPEGQAGAIGYLVGEPGQGLAIMFHMMNEARIAVGLGAAAIAMRSHALSVDYARERAQGRTSQQSKEAPPTAIIEHPDVKRMLLAQKCYAEGAFSLVLLASRLIDDRTGAADKAAFQDADLLLGLLTPIAKTWSSEWGVKASDIAIQIHGGYGYTRDFDVEQLYRDNRLNPIHEGTTGIQGIDFAGRKLMREGDRALDLLESRVLATCRSASDLSGLAVHAHRLEKLWRQFHSVAKALPSVDREALLSNATELTDAFGHIVVGWIWLDQTVLIMGDAARSESRLAAGKRAACDYFYNHELPRITQVLELARSMPRVIADTPSSVF